MNVSIDSQELESLSLEDGEEQVYSISLKQIHLSASGESTKTIRADVQEAGIMGYVNLLFTAGRYSKYDYSINGGVLEGFIDSQQSVARWGSQQGKTWKADIVF